MQEDSRGKGGDVDQRKSRDLALESRLAVPGRHQVRKGPSVSQALTFVWRCALEGLPAPKAQGTDGCLVAPT